MEDKHSLSFNFSRRRHPPSYTDYNSPINAPFWGKVIRCQSTIATRIHRVQKYVLMTLTGLSICAGRLQGGWIQVQ